MVGAAALLAPARVVGAMTGGSGAAGSDSNNAEMRDGALVLPAGAALAESPVVCGGDDEAGSEGPGMVLVDDADDVVDIDAAAEGGSHFFNAAAADSLLASAHPVVARAQPRRWTASECSWRNTALCCCC
jgi:hypothetical protein